MLKEFKRLNVKSLCIQHWKLEIGNWGLPTERRACGTKD